MSNISVSSPDCQGVADSLVDDFVVTESASAVEVAIAASAVFQQVRTTQTGISLCLSFLKL